MLTEVDVRTGQGSLLTLPLEVTNGVVVENIDGLDPVKATLVKTSFAGLNGTQYLSSSTEDRNIKIRLGLDPDVEPVRDVRTRLYNFFMPRRPVDLTFRHDDGFTANISGRIESCESPLFTKEPVVDISIICFDSDFYDPTPVFLRGSTVSDSTDFTIDYPGTVETGVTFNLEVNRPVSEFTIYNTTPDGTLRTMDFSAPLSAGNLLTITTMPGQKTAKLMNGSVESSLVYAISPQSEWIDLQPGVNKLRVYAEGLGIPTVFTYFNRYGGL